MASQGGPNAISEDVLKSQDSLSTDTDQSCQPEEPSGASGTEHTDSEDEPSHQMGDLSTSLENLSVTALPEATVVRPNQDYNLVNSLLNLTRSPVSHLFFFPPNIITVKCLEKKILFLFWHKTLIRLR